MSGRALALAVLLVIALVVTVLYVRSRENEKKRDAAYRKFCETHGFQYVASRADDDVVLGVVPFSEKGRRQTWRHEISGVVDGLGFSMFDFQYTVGYGKGETIYEQAIVRWEKEGADVPKFVVEPESLLEKVERVLGTSEIDFPEDRAFNKMYVLKGLDAPAVRRLFGADLRSYLTNHAGLHLAGELSVLFWWRPGALPPAERIDALLLDTIALRDLVFRGS